MTGDSGGRKRIVIVGGVAGGASCAARARRLSEAAEITLFERGPYISFANCALPYYVGEVINGERPLLVTTPEQFARRFNIQVNTESNVTAIDPARREVEVETLSTGDRYRTGYDALVLAPGAVPLRPPLPGIDLPGIYSLRSIPDSRQIRGWIAERKVKKVLIVGAGAIGLEMAENLSRRGIAVTIIEMQEQVMPPLDHEMVAPLRGHLAAQGVSLRLGDSVAGFEKTVRGKLRVHTRSGKILRTDMVVLAMGVRPEAGLAREAGLEMGERGGIRVDAQMRTSDPHIWAVGDAVEVGNFITGEWVAAPLAGPANRQGRIAADAIFGRRSRFRGVQGTMVCGAFGMTVAATGVTEKMLRHLEVAGKPLEYEKVYLHPNQHANYYPGASPIFLKLIFATGDGRVLGAQAVGRDGIDKRIDVLSLAIQKGATVFDLEEAEMGYAPQYGAARDPVNLAGMVAANALRGDAPIARWEDVPNSGAFILDVRTPHEYDGGHVRGAVNIPLDELRPNLSELPRERPIWVYCTEGRRSYFATRVLRLNGLDAHNLSGGILTYDNFKKPKPVR